MKPSNTTDLQARFQHPRNTPAIQFQTRNLVARLHHLQEAVDDPRKVDKVSARATKVMKQAQTVLGLVASFESSPEGTFAYAAHKAAWFAAPKAYNDPAKASAIVRSALQQARTSWA